MNVERFVGRVEGGRVVHAGDRFPLLDLEAWLEYWTSCSAGFQVGTVKGPNGGIRTAKGHVDVHHPCDGHIKVRIRCQFPKPVTPEQMGTAVEQILTALNILADETYEAYFSTAENQSVIFQDVDREGRSDRMVSKKR